MNRGSARFFLAISLVSVSTLIYEIGLTRIFSISQGYHLAFMVISIALLGIGAGGAFMTVAGGRWSVVGDQKMPIHLSTLSAVLFSLLISTGLGSYISGRFRLVERHTIHIILMVPLLAVLYLIMLRYVPEMATGLRLAERYFLTFIFFVPLGIAMGIPFPTGIAILGKDRPELIPWAWCINGSFSVISSVLAMMLALFWGFSTVHMLAAGCYIIAWLAIMNLSKGN